MAATDKRLCIISFFLTAEISNHPLIAGQLNIPAKEHIGKPQQRIEPVNSQEQKAQGLPPVVPAGNVSLLMGGHRLPVFHFQGIGQVDPGSEEAQDKGRCRKLTLVNISFQPYRCCHFSTKVPVADSSIEQHRQDTQQPEICPYGNQNLQGIGTGPGFRCEDFRDDRIHGIVQRGNSRGNLRCPICHNARADGLGAGNQTQRTFQGERAQQPQGHYTPQQHRNPPGGFFQHQPQGQHRQDQPTGRYAHIDDF